MDSFLIKGRVPLHGEVEISGAKNAVLPIMAATLLTAEALRPVRLKIEQHIKNTYLKQMQAPVGIKPTLKCWMELN